MNVNIFFGYATFLISNFVHVNFFRENRFFFFTRNYGVRAWWPSAQNPIFFVRGRWTWAGYVRLSGNAIDGERGAGFAGTTKGRRPGDLPSRRMFVTFPSHNASPRGALNHGLTREDEQHLGNTLFSSRDAVSSPSLNLAPSQRHEFMLMRGVSTVHRADDSVVKIISGWEWGDKKNVFVRGMRYCVRGANSRELSESSERRKIMKNFVERICSACVWQCEREKKSEKISPIFVQPNIIIHSFSFFLRRTPHE